MTNAVLASHRIHFDDLSNPNEVISRSVTELNKLIEKSDINRDRLIACGFIIAGAVDPIKGILRSSPALGWGTVNVDKIVRKNLNIPIFLESIANSKNLTAHSFGSTQGENNVLLFNASLAIGCSILLDGRLIRGSKANAGLIENMQVWDKDAAEYKSIDQVAGGISIIKSEDGRAGQSSDKHAQQLSEIINAGNNAEEETIKRLKRAGGALAYVISMSNALLHPDVVLVSGPLIESEIYCDAVREGLKSLINQEFIHETLRFHTMQDFEAAKSLAIYQALVQCKISQNINK
jgi:predicted NBD/HSP70 family sugar kinase